LYLFSKLGLNGSIHTDSFLQHFGHTVKVSSKDTESGPFGFLVTWTFNGGTETSQVSLKLAS